MSLTFGFYNSIDHDRLYNANDFSSIFDGIIEDGVFATYGDALMVKEAEGFTVNVGIGRAWFNHTWTLNDAILPVEGFPAELTFDRIDAVILEVDRSVAVRANSIKMVKGPVGATASKPGLMHTDTLDQYALAYITVNKGSTGIDQSNIENVIGTEETPFVIGVLETIKASELYAQWQEQFKNQLNANGQTFDEWFNNLVYVLDGDVAGHLQNQITQINSNLVANEYVITSDMWVSDTSNEDYPYKCTITSAKYKADGDYSAFVLPMATDSPFYTEEEKEFKDSLVFDNGYTSNGSISFWASEIPTVSIKFRIYGEN